MANKQFMGIRKSSKKHLNTFNTKQTALGITLLGRIFLFLILQIPRIGMLVVVLKSNEQNLLFCYL